MHEEIGKCRVKRIIFELENGEKRELTGRDLDVFIRTAEEAIVLLYTHNPEALRDWDEVMQEIFKGCEGKGE